MKAVILVGGYGTRLRPLTLSVPKPFIQFCNKALIEHQIEALVSMACEEIVLAMAQEPADLVENVAHLEARHKVKITISRETSPLGTSGPVGLAGKHLRGCGKLFVFNSDVICDYQLEKLVAFHEEGDAVGTIMTTPVKDPSRYGVVVSTDGYVDRFAEKPTQFVGDHINAGIYYFNETILDYIPEGRSTFETDVFPALASKRLLRCKPLDGYWADIGKPGDFIRGMELHLKSMRTSRAHELHDGPGIVGDVIVAPSAKIGEGCLLGPNVSVGEGCVLGDGVRLSHCAVMDHVVIESYSYLARVIVGWQSRIGKWVRVHGLTVIGKDVHVRDEIFINGASILPHKEISSDVMEEGSIIM